MVPHSVLHLPFSSLERFGGDYILVLFFFLSYCVFDSILEGLMAQAWCGSVCLLGRRGTLSQAGPGGKRFHRARPGFPWVTAGTVQEEAKGFSR